MSDLSIPGAGPYTPIPNIQRCSIIHFEDANIALVTEANIAFCVHRGVLRRLSSVFADMLEVCEVPRNGSQAFNQVETFETLPVIKISDSPNAVRDFFRIVYDQKPELSSLEYERLAALMIFCHKYMIDAIFDKIVTILRGIFPDKLSDWDPIERFHMKYSDDVAHILSGIATANVRILLPSCLYAVVSRPTLKAHLHRFPHPLLLQYMQGFSKLLVYHFDFFHNILPDLGTPSMECAKPNCKIHWDKFKDFAQSQFYDQGWATDPDPLLLLQYFYDFDKSDDSYCTECLNAIEKLFQTALNQLWNSLPQTFGIANSWEEIRKEVEPEGET